MFQQISSHELSIFTYAACIGTTIFFIQLILNFFGFGDEDEKLFKWLSIQSLAGFLMMFGLTGLTTSIELNWKTEWVALCSIGMGILTVYVTRKIFQGAKKLHSPGSVYRVEDMIGKEGFVYQRIPKDGIGKVTIQHNEMTYEVDAESNEEIHSFQRVQIIKTKDENRVVVIRI